MVIEHRYQRTVHYNGNIIRTEINSVIFMVTENIIHQKTCAIKYKHIC
jgi:hypothetical protein